MSLKPAIPCPGYAAAGAGATRYEFVGDIFGNNNYQSAGDLFTASQFGMSGIEFVSTQERTGSQTYQVAAIYPANSSNSNEGVAPTPQNFTLHWYAANGTEVANNSNLAAEVIRIMIRGV